MNEHLIVGFIIGTLLSVPIGYLLVLQYRRILMMCAKCGGTEKLGDEFYFIIAESRVYWIEVNADDGSATYYVACVGNKEIK